VVAREFIQHVVCLIVDAFDGTRRSPTSSNTAKLGESPLALKVRVTLVGNGVLGLAFGLPLFEEGRHGEMAHFAIVVVTKTDESAVGENAAIMHPASREIPPTVIPIPAVTPH